MLRDLNTGIGKDYFRKRTRVKQDVHFVNVDLEVWSKEDLQDLTDAFGENVRNMGHIKFDNGDVLAAFELRDDEIDPLTIEPERTINGFCRLIENLPENARRLWNEADKKVFDVGFESGNTDRTYHTPLKAETLHRTQALGADILITIYPVLQYVIVRKDEL